MGSPAGCSDAQRGKQLSRLDLANVGRRTSRRGIPTREVGIRQRIEEKLSIDLGVDKHSIRPLGGRRFSEFNTKRKAYLAIRSPRFCEQVGPPPEGFPCGAEPVILNVMIVGLLPEPLQLDFGSIRRTTAVTVS
jgi:hypothetical protein